MPVVGADKVARLFAGMSREIATYQVSVELHEVNGQPGAVMRTADGELINVFALDISDGVFLTVRSVINPDKLRHLGPVADVRAIRGFRRARHQQ
jgi:RNA polymerase sigma-70 factor (ECF subfamily)